MEKLNLVLKFKLIGEGQCHVRGAASIKIDGRGDVTVYERPGDAGEVIDSERLQSLWIQPVLCAGHSLPTAALVC